MDELVGQIIAGRFRIKRLIGKGGMGTVYEARHLALPRTYAIKILRRELAKDEGFIERFRREAIAMSRVEHPNVIYITDYGKTAQGDVYLVMEYLEGIGLDEILQAERRIPPSRAISIVAQIADALDVAHQVNVIHRDLKPENILMTEYRGRQDYVKLLDFGIAKVQTPEFDGAPLTIQGEVFGTAEYMSPEQALGKHVDGRSDIYALGCLAYELLTGDPPFLGVSVEVLRAHVYEEPAPPSTRLRKVRLMPALDALVLRCLAKKPEKRYQSCADLRHDLMRVRALLFSGANDQAERSRITGRLAAMEDREAMVQGWRRLGGRIPEMFLPGSVEPTLSEVSLASTRPPKEPVGDPEKLRSDLWEVLRKLAISLDKAAVAPQDVSELIERLLVVEEREATLTGSMAITEQNFDRVRFEYGQLERRLRQAILYLNMDRAELQGRFANDPASALSAHDAIRDLNFQIDALNKRCKEVDEERDVQIQELAQEVKRIHGEQRRLEQEAADIYQALMGHVEQLRSECATTPGPDALYRKLDRIKKSLELARA